MGIFNGKASLTGRQASMTEFLRVLANVLGRTVIDKTDLKGSFDFDLTFAPDAALDGLPGGTALPISADPKMGVTIFTAIQEQLGLKLESTTGPVQLVVIDSIQKPSEN
jgi:bla regulator protein blaR1